MTTTKKLWLPLALAATLALPLFAAEGDAEVRKEIQDLRDMLYKQQSELNALKAAKADKSDTKMLANLPTLGFGDNVQGIKITGDLRLRYEHLNLSGNTKDKADEDRFRTRLRIGGIWQVPSENWEIGAGIATGSNTPNSTSTNATWGEGAPGANPAYLYLDYAYAKHTWKLGDGEDHILSLTAGQQKNPYLNGGILWDSDVNLPGLTAQYQNDTLFGETLGGFASTGWYMIRGDQNPNQTDKELNTHAQMFAGQAGLKYADPDRKQKGTLAAGGYVFNNTTLDYYQGTTQSLKGSDFQWQIGQVYGEFTQTLDSGIEFGPYADVWYNFGSTNDALVGQTNGANSGNNLGYQLGLKGKYQKWSGSLDYIYSGAYSGFWPLMDSDFGSGIRAWSDMADVQGWRLKGSYALYKNMSINLSWMMYGAVNRENTQTGNLVQLDFNYKF